MNGLKAVCDQKTNSPKVSQYKQTLGWTCLYSGLLTQGAGGEPFDWPLNLCVLWHLSVSHR